jgi:hypothetical protein
MRKIMLLALIVTLLGATAFSQDLLAKKNSGWRVYNYMPATSKLWDINQAKIVSGGVQFPVQQFLSTTTGSFAVYLLDNYNTDMTGKTITADATWTSGPYVTRNSGCATAYVRLEFQDVTAGPYDSNDYWWSTIYLDLNTVTSGELAASLADRTLWTNQAGKSANDTTENWLDWTGSTVALSPYDGFTNAVKNVKQVGLSFGNTCSSYASGIALQGGTGTFTLNTFTIF